jgi:hypothetical protein
MLIPLRYIRTSQAGCYVKDSFEKGNNFVYIVSI